MLQHKSTFTTKTVRRRNSTFAGGFLLLRCGKIETIARQVGYNKVFVFMTAFSLS